MHAASIPARSNPAAFIMARKSGGLGWAGVAFEGGAPEGVVPGGVAPGGVAPGGVAAGGMDPGGMDPGGAAPVAFKEVSAGGHSCKCSGGLVV